MDLFGTAGIRGRVGDRITPELSLSVGRAVAAESAVEEVVVGRDGRTTGAGLADALASGLLAGGAAVRRIGVVPTPALAFASQGRHGVMLTASHNPPTDNGIKVFADGVEFDRDGERRIEARVADGVAATSWDEWGRSERESVLASYREAVATYAEEYGEPLDGLKVCVDCGNGMSAVATPQVLRALGADVTALNANVDGHFPGRESKPTEETLGDQIAFMEAGSFDLGIAHDGDADRIVVLAPDGAVVHEDTIVAMLAERYTATAEVDDPVVVTTPNASGRIDERVEAAGGRVERVRLGALHEGIARVREDGSAETKVVFAAEPWKHIHTDFGGWIDGVCSAAVISRLVADAGDLATLREPIAERPYRKVSVECPDDAKEPTMGLVADRLPEAFPDASVSTDYGVRLSMADGSWILVRPSGTEPYVRVYAESEEVDDLVDAAVSVVQDAVDDAS